MDRRSGIGRGTSIKRRKYKKKTVGPSMERGGTSTKKKVKTISKEKSKKTNGRKKVIYCLVRAGVCAHYKR